MLEAFRRFLFGARRAECPSGRIGLEAADINAKTQKPFQTIFKAENQGDRDEKS